MSVRKGFTLIELIIVLTVIGIISTIGYQFYSKIMMKAKAQKIVSTFQQIRKSVADTLGSAGGYYQSTGSSGMGVASPQPLPTPVPGKTCGYDATEIPTDVITIERLGQEDSPTQDTTCYGQRIEKDLHDNLIKIGMKWVANTHDFRLPTAPLAHISFPFEVNGVRTIRVYGIQGDLAYQIFKIANGTKSFSQEDGWTPQRPVAIAKINTAGDATKYGAGSEADCLTSLDTLDTVQKSFNCLVTGQTSLVQRDGTYFFIPGEEEIVKNKPKVVLYYTYAFGYDSNATQ